MMSKAHAQGIFVLTLMVSILLAATLVPERGADASPDRAELQRITHFYWHYLNYSQQGSELAFSALGVEDTNYSWDFGDGTIGYGQHPSHLYTAPGTYNVTLTTRFEGGSSNTTSQILTLNNDPPIPDFYWEPETPTTQDIVYFWDTSVDPDGDIVNWTWAFGDGSIAYGNGTQHRYDDDGVYDVQLTVRDNLDNVKSVTKQLIVFNVPPEADFYWTKEGGALRFLDYSTDPDGDIVNWTWDFGDGGTSYQQNPLHNYSQEGTYTVTLTVRDNDGAAHTVQKTIDTYNKIPTVMFFWSPFHPTILDTVEFNDSSFDLDGTIVNWTWDFGDGTTSYQHNPTHHYDQKITYEVTLTIIDDGGALNSLTKNLQVVNAPPLANFTWQPAYPVDGENISFNDTSVDADGTIVNWTWDFGDGSSGYGPQVTHAYAQSGTYTVTLTVIDNNGSTVTLTRELLVANMYVDDDADPAWYDARHVRTVQEGVDNASAGHFIYVLPGTYAENVVINKQVTITGLQAVVDAAGSGDALTITAPRVSLHNLTITNASHGRGVVIDGDNATVTHCTLTDHNIALAVNGNHAQLSHNTIMGYGVGRGAVVSGSYNRLDSNSFDHLQNAIRVVSGIHNVLVGNHYAGNVFAVQVLSGESTSVTDSYFSGNSYGIDIMGGTGCTLDNNTFRNNGEALRVFISGLLIVDHTFEGNTVGLGIYAPYTTVDDCTFQDNNQAVRVEGASHIVLATCAFSGNERGIMVQDATDVELRGHSFTAQEESPLSLDNVTQVMVSQCWFTANGGPVDVRQSSNVQITECSFADQPAGINISHAEAVVDNSTFSHLEVAVHLSGPRTSAVTDATIHNATQGIYLGGSSHVVRGCDIHHSTYALYAEDAAHLTLAATLHHNTYGVYLANTTNSTLQGSTLHNNTYGVYIAGGEANTVMDTTLRDHDKAVVLAGTSSSLLQALSLSSNRLGVEATGSDHATITNASLVANHMGLILSYSPYTTVSGTTFTDNDYALDVDGSAPRHFIQHMHDSAVNGKAIYYALNQSSVNLSDGSYGYLGLVNCRQVTMTNVSTQPNGEGLLVVNATGVTVTHSQFSGHLDGMVWMYVQDSLINRTTVSGNARDGLLFTASSDIRITHCMVRDNAQRGINAYSIAAEDGRLVVSNCTISNNWLGVNVENIHHNTFSHNTITGNHKAGLRFFASPSNTLADNYLADNGDGVLVRQSTFLTIRNHLFENNTRSLYLSKAQDVLIENCTFAGSGTGLEAEESQVTVSNSSFSDHDHAALLAHSTVTCVHTTFQANTYGVHATSSLVTVQGCTVSGNTYGLSLFQSNGSVITACLSPGIANNTYGLLVNQSNQVNVTDAVLAENEHALVIHSSLGVQVDNVTAFNNTHAVILTGTTAQTVLHYSLLHHNSHALDIEASNNTVVNCSLWRNMYGVRILSGTNNTLYHNNFAFNWYQAQDRGNNTWDDGYPSGGNYWSDYAGTDAYRGPGQNLSGSDHLGDMPYPIAKGLNRDRYPLMGLNVNASPIPNDPPTARFDFYPRQPFSQDTVLFIDTSTDPNGDLDIVSWHWDFGDGNTSSQQHPQHAYAVSGTYTVSLTVEDRHGLSSTSTVVITVSNVPPISSFTSSPAAPTTGQSIQFTDASTDLDGTIVNWTWDFGDGGTSQAQNPVHTYHQPGIKTVTLTVTDNRGGTATATRQIEVVNALPTAQFFFVPQEPTAGEAINFTDTSSDDGEIVSWHWDFGDGTASDAQNPQHIYEEKGTYTVSLTVKDNHGGENTTTQTVTVKDTNDTPGLTLLLVLGAAIAALTLASRKRKREKL